MIGELTNHLWQTTMFAIAAAIVAFAFRKSRAQVRFWVWLAASLKFFVPFSLLIDLGKKLWESATAGQPVVTVAEQGISATMVQITQPFSEDFVYSPAVRHTTNWIAFAVFAVWASGFVYVALLRFRGWLVIRAALRASAPMDVPAAVPVRSAAGLLEPGAVGFVRPVLLLPEGIAKKLTPQQLEAVPAHEQCHIRRRDNLTSALHMIVEAIFWFHPAVWWIGARMVEERERACDEAVLSSGNEPHVYAEGILNVCKSYLESPLACVSGVTGSDLKKRIGTILTGRVAGELTLMKKLALATAAMAALAAPILVGVFGAPALRAQITTANRPQFDVASVKPCDKNSPPPPSAGRGGADGSASTGRMDLPCGTLAHLIEVAYVEFPNGVRQPRLAFKPLPIEGGPAWVKSDTFLISAETESEVTPLMMRGPMLQRILEDRFKLKVHRETREVPVYELTVAKGGLKIKHTEPGSCVDEDLTNVGRPPEPGEKPLCVIGMRINGNNVTVWSRGMTLNQICHYLDGIGIDRPVIDKTDVADTQKFDIQLEFSVDETTPGLHPRSVGDAGYQGDPLFPSLFTAVQQVGLKLVPARGPAQFVVVDGVERPSGN